MKTYQLYMLFSMMYLTQAVKESLILVAMGVFWSMIAVVMFFYESKK